MKNTLILAATMMLAVVSKAQLAISGGVENGQGRPVAGATVKLRMGSKEVSATTDQYGGYYKAMPEAGTWELTLVYNDRPYPGGRVAIALHPDKPVYHNITFDNGAAIVRPANVDHASVARIRTGVAADKGNVSLPSRTVKVPNDSLAKMQPSYNNARKK